MDATGKFTATTVGNWTVGAVQDAIVGYATVTVFKRPPVVNESDKDHDGLPDTWEVQHFGNLTYGPIDDPDHDSYTNLQEYQKGTDPMNPNDPPKPKPHNNGGGMGFATIAGIGALVALIVTGGMIAFLWSRRRKGEKKG
jgi:hypothetical protein